jgi:hypothetical protein
MSVVRQYFSKGVKSHLGNKVRWYNIIDNGEKAIQHARK